MTGKADGYQYHFRFKKGCEEEHYHLTSSIMANYKSEQSKRLIAVQSDLNHSYLVMSRSEEYSLDNQLRKLHVQLKEEKK